MDTNFDYDFSASGAIGTTTSSKNYVYTGGNAVSRKSTKKNPFTKNDKEKKRFIESCKKSLSNSIENCINYDSFSYVNMSAFTDKNHVCHKTDNEFRKLIKKCNDQQRDEIFYSALMFGIEYSIGKLSIKYETDEKGKKCNQRLFIKGRDFFNKQTKDFHFSNNSLAEFGNIVCLDSGGYPIEPEWLFDKLQCNETTCIVQYQRNIDLTTFMPRLDVIAIKTLMLNARGHYITNDIYAPNREKLDVPTHKGIFPIYSFFK